MRLPAVLAALVLAAVASAELPPDCRFGAGRAARRDAARREPARGPDPDRPHRGPDAGEPLLRSLLRAAAPRQDVDRRAQDDVEPRSDRRAARSSPFHQHDYCEVADLDHSWNGTHRRVERRRDGRLHRAERRRRRPDRRRARWATTRSATCPSTTSSTRTFAMGDRYFCSVLGPTFPNRFYLLAGTSLRPHQQRLPDRRRPSSRSARSSTCSTRRRRDAGRSTTPTSPSAVIFAYVRDHIGPTSSRSRSSTRDAAAGTLPAGRVRRSRLPRRRTSRTTSIRRRTCRSGRRSSPASSAR